MTSTRDRVSGSRIGVAAEDDIERVRRPRIGCKTGGDRGRPAATSVRPVDLVVSELAVIAFPDGRATLLERGPGVTVEQVIAATEAKLALPDQILEMRV